MRQQCLDECVGVFCSIAKCVMAIGKIALGIGTLLLGLAAIKNVPELYEVVHRIQGLNQTISSLEKIEKQNYQILCDIENLLSKENHKTATDVAKNPEKIQELLQSLSSSSTCHFINSKKSNHEEILNKWSSLKTFEERVNYANKLLQDSSCCENNTGVKN